MSSYEKMALREDGSQSPDGLIKEKHIMCKCTSVGLELFIIWNGATAHPYNKADLIAVFDIPGN